jgi:hypothetical protein
MVVVVVGMGRPSGSGSRYRRDRSYSGRATRTSALISCYGRYRPTSNRRRMAVAGGSRRSRCSNSCYIRSCYCS